MMTGRSLTSVALLVFVCYRVAAADTPAGQERPPAPLAEFGVGKGGRPLLVPVTVGGKESLFCLDTGASRTAFDLSFKATLGTSQGESPVETSAGHARVELYPCPDARLGPLDLRVAGPVVCCDLQPIRYATGEEVYGVLGMDFLRRFAVEVDFDRGKVRFFGDAPDEWGSEPGALPIDYRRGGCPSVEAELPGPRRERFLLDTGATACSLEAAAFDSLLANGDMAAAAAYRGSTIAGEVKGRSGHVDRIVLGRFAHERVRMDRDRLSVLGMRYLSRYSVRFDFPGGVVRLREGSAYGGAEPLATSGLAVVQVEGRKLVRAVEPGGAGEDAGVREGDVITGIDGEEASALDLFSVGRILTSRVGRNVPLRVTTAGRERQVTLTLRSRVSATQAGGP